MPDEHGFPTPAEIPSVYANNARLATSPLDFRIYFGEVIPQNLPTTAVAGQTQSVGRVADRVCIVIAPDIAKGLIEALTKALTDFETKVRPLIKLPDAKTLPDPKK